MTAYQANFPRMQTASGVNGASGDTAIIAPPGAGLQICILSMSVQNNSGTNTLCILKETGSGTPVEHITTGAFGSGKIANYTDETPKCLAYNQGLTMNLSAASSHVYTIDYIVKR